MINRKIFIACDTANIKKIKEIINLTKTKKINIGYKFGLEFFYSKLGRSFITRLDKKKIIFLDLKLNDIPNTCKSALESIKDIKNIRYITAHINGGLEMLKVIKKTSKRINKKIKVIGVTVLTSLSNTSLREIGHTKNINTLVVQQAKLARSAGLDGIVCSANEAKIIKKICSNMEIITPGIRLQGDKANDQSRIASPKFAFNNGATGIVIGRSITNGSIKNNLERLIRSIN